MKIVLAGGGGFLGRALAARLSADSHAVVVLSRAVSSPPGPEQTTHPAPARVAWVPDGSVGPWAAELEGADAVVNLAGEPVADHRWTASVKARIHDSRLLAARSLTAAARTAARPPLILVAASAVGCYGSRGDDLLTEDDPPGADFLSGVCAASERESLQAAPRVQRIVILRSGIVLSADGGALARMITPFKLYAGGPLGTGRQFVSWIHREDWLRLVLWVLATEQVTGPVNATAPNPVTNAEFARALGRALHKPSGMPIPPVALRLALGELADAMLLASQRALPAKATSLGFTFTFPELGAALTDVLAR